MVPCLCQIRQLDRHYACPDSKVHGANMGPTWVLSAPDGPHVGPMNLAIRVQMPWQRIIHVFYEVLLAIRDFKSPLLVRRRWNASLLVSWHGHLGKLTLVMTPPPPSSCFAVHLCVFQPHTFYGSSLTGRLSWASCGMWCWCLLPLCW